jgi:hypothetical protein
MGAAITITVVEGSVATLAGSLYPDQTHGGSIQ